LERLSTSHSSAVSQFTRASQHPLSCFNFVDTTQARSVHHSLLSMLRLLLLQLPPLLTLWWSLQIFPLFEELVPFLLAHILHVQFVHKFFLHIFSCLPQHRSCFLLGLHTHQDQTANCTMYNLAWLAQLPKWRRLALVIALYLQCRGWCWAAARRFVGHCEVMMVGCP